MVDQNGVVEIRDFTLPPAVDTDEIKDFTLPGGDKPIPFRISDDVFFAVSTIPLGLLPDVVAAGEGLTTASVDKIEKLLKVFDVLLWDESAELLRARTKDKKHPVSDKHIAPIVQWLLEKYGLRPTQPSENSSPSSDGTDESTTSTDGASHVESISTASPSLDS